jgi:ParB family chromosome partitioning protein
MSKAAKRLGRGLESLISNLRAESSENEVPVAREPEKGASDKPGPRAVPKTIQADPPPLAARKITPEPQVSLAAKASAAGEPMRIPLGQIVPNPFQPRKDFDEGDIAALANSIAQHGVLQPVTVRRAGDRFQLVAGERRWRAAKQAGLSEIPAIVRVASDQQMLELALVENLQREDLNPIDRAKAYRQFCREFGLSVEEVADRVGDDRTTVTNYMRLLELEPELQAMVSSGQLGVGHARSLLSISDPTRRREVAKAAVDRQLSVRAVEDLARLDRMGKSGSKGGSGARSAHLRDLETRFEQSVKTKVTISEGRRKGSGRIVIEYYTLDDFDRIATLLGVSGE